MWKSGVERAKNNDARQEDFVKTNVKDFKEIDLGFDFVFANTPLVVNDKEDAFDYKSVAPAVEFLTKYYGWRLPTVDDLNDIFTDEEGEIKDNFHIGCVSKFAYTVEIYDKDYYKNSSNVLIIKWQNWGTAKFLIEPREENRKLGNITTWCLRRKYDDPNDIQMSFGIEPSYTAFPVILIKDKKK